MSWYNPFSWGGGDSDPSSFTATSGGAAPSGGNGLAYEGIDKQQDSQTQYLRSLTNSEGKAGVDNLGQGNETVKSGLEDMQPSIDIFRQLLSGDRAETASAMQPQTDAIAEQFGQIRNMFSQTGARGGGTTSTLAEAPYKQQREVADLSSQARMNAAGKLPEIGGEVARIGQGQASMGAGMMGNTLSSLLGERGQDFTVDQSNMGNLMTGLKMLI